MNRKARLEYMKKWNRKRYADPKIREEIKRRAKLRAKNQYTTNTSHRAEKLAYQKKYNKENADKIREYQRQYRAENRVRLSALSNEYHKMRYATDPEFREKKKAGMRRLYATPAYRTKANADRALRKITDPTFRIIEAQRRRIRDALKGINKSAKTMELLGCTVAEFRKHIESLWKPRMNWENYGYDGWHCDHRVPVAKFFPMNEENQKKCFSYKNLQPLWRAENQSKGAK